MGMDFCTCAMKMAMCVMSFSFVFTPKNTTNSTLEVVQALGRGPRISMVTPEALLVCPANARGGRWGMARHAVSCPQATVNTVARMLHATPVECGHVMDWHGHDAIQMQGSMCTHRLVPYTRRHALLFGRYSRYAVFLNCFLNSGRCLWGLAWSGWDVLACVRTNACIAYLKWNLARSCRNASCATTAPGWLEDLPSPLPVHTSTTHVCQGTAQNTNSDTHPSVSVKITHFHDA